MHLRLNTTFTVPLNVRIKTSGIPENRRFIDVKETKS